MLALVISAAPMTRIRVPILCCDGTQSHSLMLSSKHYINTHRSAGWNCVVEYSESHTAGRVLRRLLSNMLGLGELRE